MSQLLDPIEEELVKAGEASSVSPTVVKLDKFRIMSDTDVPPEEFLIPPSQVLRSAERRFSLRCSWPVVPRRVCSNWNVSAMSR